MAGWGRVEHGACMCHTLKRPQVLHLLLTSNACQLLSNGGTFSRPPRPARSHSHGLRYTVLQLLARFTLDGEVLRAMSGPKSSRSALGKPGPLFPTSACRRTTTSEVSFWCSNHMSRFIAAKHTARNATVHAQGTLWASDSPPSGMVF